MICCHKNKIIGKIDVCLTSLCYSLYIESMVQLVDTLVSDANA